MSIEFERIRGFHLNRIPSRREKFVTVIIRWGIIGLIVACGVSFDANEKLIALSIQYKAIIALLIGIVFGSTLEISMSYLKDFLIKRRNKKKGYFICKTCNGNGWTPKSSRHWFLRRPSIRSGIKGTCMICRGRGYVDWIENVVGSKGCNNDTVGRGPSTGGISGSV